MRSFNDTRGRQWTVDLNVQMFKKVRAELDIDMLNPESVTNLVGDPITLCDILYAVSVGPSPEITAEEFGRSMSGDVLEKAQEAFLEEYIDFFPNPTVRETLRKLVGETKSGRNRMLDALKERESLIRASIDKNIDEAIVKMEKTLTRGK